ncbi:MAG: hypothetical protein ACYST6_07330 [Planctomycetota bacterium]|jgi:hypothetical protein
MDNHEGKSRNWVAKVVAVVACFGLVCSGPSAAGVAEGRLADIPVKEVTIFKDGHVLVLHEGEVGTDDGGNVVLDYLPTPILGTFWAYSAESKAKLAGVVSGRRVVSIDRTALNIRELIEANVGAKARITEEDVSPYECTILGIPTRSTEELAVTSPPGTPERVSERGEIVLLKFPGGVKAVPMGRIEEIVFIDEPRPTVSQEEFRNIMTLKLDWEKGKPQKKADVGMIYVQRGIRWIPSYRIDIDGKGNAVVKLQATLINELADVEDVKAHLVIGVPSFAFEKTPDPISLQDSFAGLSRVFRGDSRMARQFLSNTIRTQVSYQPDEASRGGGAIDLAPEVGESGKREDLYVFTLEHVTLKKGQRMVVPVAEYKLKYRDVYTLDLPFGPPPEVRQRFDDNQQAELAKLLGAPRVMHKIRLENKSKSPLTTAPALILHSGRVMAQGMMTYTPVGAAVDLELTTAVDIAVNKLDKEAGREPEAVKWDDRTYERIELAGGIRVTNHKNTAVSLEVRRSILGNIDSANKDGVVERLSRYEGGWGVTPEGSPVWWRWFNWPSWWYHFNGIGRITWSIEVKPKETVELEYKWHYFWRP